MPVQIISLHFSHWPFHLGLYKNVLLVAIRKLCMCDTNSEDINDFPRSEWI